MSIHPVAADKATTALLTDHYELTMVRAAMKSGTAFRHSVFELFCRRLPQGRRYGVVAGTGRALDAVENFRFDEATLAFLLEQGIIDDPTAEWARNYTFSGDMWGYGEGEVYFPGAPLLGVEGSFADCCVLETVLLSIFNHDCAIAAAGSRMTSMAEGRPCIEMGSRRTHDQAAVASARAAWIVGFAASSNLEAGRRYGVPTTGTAAHSFTLLHDDEKAAFAAQVAALGTNTTLLVDTYDIEQGIRHAIEVAGTELGAIRLDSGDLRVVAQESRQLLDSLGATKTRIVVTSDLDEWQLAALRGAPVDGYGVGTSLVTGSGHPTCGLVYKLVARATSDSPDAELIPVQKKSSHKTSVGGRKFALRRLDDHGIAEADLVGVGKLPAGDHNDRALLVDLICQGDVVGREPLAAARERHIRAMSEMPKDAFQMSKGEPCVDTLMVEADGAIVPNPYAQQS